jgi:uncharacterized membrane protein YfcA
MHTAGLLMIGIGAGVLSGMFGIGGGLVIVPALALIFGMKQHAAVGTSLGALLLPVGALSAWVYWKNGNLNIGYSALIALGLFLGAYVGARLVEPVSDITLRRMFGVFLILVSLRLIWGK